VSLRPPQHTSAATAPESGFDALGYEILSEKAAALGRAGERATDALEQLRRLDRRDPERAAALSTAAKAVHAYFIQRELCGLRRHDEIIREFGIPKDVLARLGAL
jgi:hypothetical protein